MMVRLILRTCFVLSSYKYGCVIALHEGNVLVRLLVQVIREPRSH